MGSVRQAATAKNKAP